MDCVLTLTAGENRPLPSPAVTVSVRSVSPVNTSAILLTDAGRVRSDADLIFYNQPSGPGVSYRSAGNADIVSVDTTALPREITTVVIAASLDGTGPTGFATAGALTATVTGGGEELTFTPTGLTSEAAVVCLEIYRRNDLWKVRAVGQGYDSGLSGLATAFGIEVDDDPVPAPAPGQPPRMPGSRRSDAPHGTTASPPQSGGRSAPSARGTTPVCPGWPPRSASRSTTIRSPLPLRGNPRECPAAGGAMRRTAPPLRRRSRV
uniref:TerD family protein n=1 Tax=Gordonia sp. 'Campus' TaxID=2915824 RepID=UPI001EE4D147